MIMWCLHKDTIKLDIIGCNWLAKMKAQIRLLLNSKYTPQTNLWCCCIFLLKIPKYLQECKFFDDSRCILMSSILLEINILFMFQGCTSRSNSSYWILNLNNHSEIIVQCCFTQFIVGIIMIVLEIYDLQFTSIIEA